MQATMKTGVLLFLYPIPWAYKRLFFVLQRAVQLHLFICLSFLAAQFQMLDLQTTQCNNFQRLALLAATVQRLRLFSTIANPSTHNFVALHCSAHAPLNGMLR